MGKVNKKFTTKVKSVASNLQQKIATNVEKNNKSNLLLHKTIAPQGQTSKKHKLKQRHANLLQKFKLLKKQRKEDNARKNREKTAVIGDLKPLKDALPSLDELFQLSKREDVKTGVKEFDEPQPKLSVKQKYKNKKNKFISQVNSYQALLNDPDFKKTPREVIAYHIKYTHGLID